MDTHQTKTEKNISNIVKPFDPKKINIQTKQVILEAIFRRLKNDEIDLLTGFQRQTGLWDETQQSQLIESILIRFPLPAFYFDGSKYDKWLVVDGLQRLSTFKNFVVDKTLHLQNLEYLPQFDGKTFDELPGDLQRRIEEHEITIYIINPGTPIEVRYNIFKRINTGGLMLEPAEIRHALNQGKPADFIQELSQLEAFKEATTDSIPTERMQDRDYITRFIAFYLQPITEYQGHLEQYLNAAMSAINQLNQNQLATIKQDFIAAMITAKKIFDKDAFRKIAPQKTEKNNINKALFEVWSVLLAKLTKEQQQALVNNAALVKKYFINLNHERKFTNSISQEIGEKKNVLIRFSEINALINKVLKS